MAVSERLRASLWMIGAVLSFTVSTLAVRELGDAFSVFQIAFLRNVIGLPLVLTIVFSLHGRAGFGKLKSGNFKLQLARNGFHIAGQYAWMYGVMVIPLALVFALEYSTPLWAAVLAILILHEWPDRGQKVGLVIGLLGVLLIVRPGAGGLSWGVVLVLAAALAYAVTYLCMRVLGRTDSGMTIVFWMCVIQIPLGLPFALLDWRPIDLDHLPTLLVLTAGSLFAHQCMSVALRLAPMAQVMPIDYLRLPLISVLGAVLYGEAIDPLVLVGGGVVLVGVVLAQNGTQAKPSRQAASATSDSHGVVQKR